jgi:hypothetical protein
VSEYKNMERNIIEIKEGKVDPTKKKEIPKTSDKKNKQGPDIRDLNFLTVNYLQRKALIENPKLLEEITKIIKEIITIIS